MCIRDLLPRWYFLIAKKEARSIQKATLTWHKDMNPAFLEILLGTMAFFTFVMAARSEVSTGKVSSHAPLYQRNTTQTNNADA